MRHSHLALAAAPVKVAYDEGEGGAQQQQQQQQQQHHPFRQHKNNRSRGVRLTVSVTLGQASLREVLYAGGGDDSSGARPTPSHVGDLLSFARGSRGDFSSTDSSDLAVVYREEEDDDSDERDLAGAGSRTKSSVDVALRPCKVDLDPGIYDRTYLLFNYAELCPEDTPRRKGDPDDERLQSPPSEGASPSSSSSSRVDLSFRCPDLDLGLWVPRADIRRARDVPRFVEAFWARRVHPEEFRFRLGGLDLRIGVPGDQGGGCPLEVRVSADKLSASFRSSPSDGAVTLVKMRRSKERGHAAAQARAAAYVYVAVNLDDEDLLRVRQEGKKILLNAFECSF